MSNRSKYLRFTGAFMIMILFIFAIWYMVADHSPMIEDYVGEQVQLESVGLDATPPEADLVSVFGKLFFTSPSEFYPVNTTVSYSHEYDFLTQTHVLTAAVPMRDYNHLNDGEGVVLSTDSQQPDEKAWRPYRYDVATESLTTLPTVEGYWINDLQVSADGTHYAYNFMTENNPAPVVRDSAFWSIAIHSFSDDTVVTLSGAMEPTWINDGADLLYLAADGVHLYNLATGNNTIVFDDYVPYNYHDDLAASPNSEHVVLTIPFIEGKTSVSVFSVEEAEDGSSLLSETGRIASDDTKRRSPVFSPDSRYFAVMAAKESRADGSSNIPEVEKTVEIRTLTSAEPVKVITIPEDDPAPIELEAWIQ